MTTPADPGLTRRMWHQLEPIHAMFWSVPEVFAEAEALGYDVRTRWPSYFVIKVWIAERLEHGSSAA